jgi:DUF2905 family protein
MEVRRLLIFAGVGLVLVGVLWPWLAKFPLGRLPGDIAIHRQNVHIYVPLATSLLISLVLTLLFWLFRK